MENNESLLRQTMSKFETDDVRVNRYTRKQVCFYISSLLLSSAVTLMATLYLQKNNCNDKSIFCPTYNLLLNNSESF